MSFTAGPAECGGCWGTEQGRAQGQPYGSAPGPAQLSLHLFLKESSALPDRGDAHEN